MIDGVVVRRYAKALFELCSADGSAEAVGEELSRLRGVFLEIPELKELLSNPAYTRAERREIADAVLSTGLGASDVLRNFVGVLIENGRVRGIPEVADRYQEMADEAAGRAQVIVKSASPLSDAVRSRLEEGLSRVTGKRVTVEIEIDPSLIGGLCARVGGVVFDGSIRAQLDAMQEELKGAS